MSSSKNCSFDGGYVLVHLASMEGYDKPQNVRVCSCIKAGTYQVQTNLSVQTMETSIWIIRSTSKGTGAERWEEGFAKV
jgi:hypothetical protein